MLNRKLAPWVPVLGLAAALAAGILILRRPPGETISNIPQERRGPSIPSAMVPSASPGVLPTARPEPGASASSRARVAFHRVLEALRQGDREKIKAALEDLRAECAPPPVPDLANAAHLYKKAFEAYPEESAPGDEEMESMDRLSHGFAVTVEERAHLQAVLDRSREALRLLHEAAGRPGCDFGVDLSQGINTRLDHLSGVCRCARLLRLEALLNDGPTPPDIVQAAGHLAEAGADIPVIVCKLVRNVGYEVSRDLRQQEFDGEMSSERLRALVASGTPDHLRSGLEKAFLMEAYSTIKAVVEGLPILQIAQGLPADSRLPPGSPGTPSLDDPGTRLDLTRCAEALAKLGALAERPYYQVRDELGALKTEWGLADAQFGWITRISTGSYDRTFEGIARAEAAEGAAQIAAALRLYREAGGGEYPASLEALRAVLPSPPLDPFTGKPFLYRREGTGFVVYSAGPDGNGSGLSGDSEILFRSRR